MLNNNGGSSISVLVKFFERLVPTGISESFQFLVANVSAEHFIDEEFSTACLLARDAFCDWTYRNRRISVSFA